MSNKIKHTHLILIALLLPLLIGLFRILSTQEIFYYLKKIHRNTLIKEIAVSQDSLHSTFAFGVNIPNKYDIHGIDVSRYQNTILWEKLPDNLHQEFKIHFAFIKATEGESMVDEQFLYNWTNVKKAGVIRGAYHFFHPKLDANVQAKHFLESVKLRRGDLPPVLDIEISQGLDAPYIRHQVKQWIEIVEKYYNRKPIIYTNYKYFQLYLKGAFDDYPIWLAHYNQSNASLENGQEWTFWQYSENGELFGIDGKVDLNAFNGDSTALRKLCF